MQSYRLFTLFVTIFLFPSCGESYFLSTIYHLVEKTCKRPFFSQPFKANILCAVHCFKAPTCQAFGTSNNTCSLYSSFDNIKEGNVRCYTAFEDATMETAETATVKLTEAETVPPTTTTKMTTETEKQSTSAAATTETTITTMVTTIETPTTITTPETTTIKTETTTDSSTSLTTDYSTSTSASSTTDPSDFSFCYADFDSSSSTFTCCEGSVFYGIGFCTSEERVCDGICIVFPSPENVNAGTVIKKTDECTIAFTAVKMNSNSFTKSCVSLNGWVVTPTDQIASETFSPPMNITGTQSANPDKWFLCDTSAIHSMYGISYVVYTSNVVGAKCRRLIQYE